MYVGTASAESGEKGIGYITTRLSDGRKVNTPVGIVRGKEKGPILYAQAGQHGMELNGIVAIAKTFRQLKPEKLSGTIIAVPTANPLALMERRPHFGLGPEEAYDSRPRLNMNRLWPGDPNGSEAERLACELWKQAIEKADCVIDIHSYERWSASCTIVGPKKESLELAEAFGLRFISVRKKRRRGRLIEEPWKMVTDAVEERGVPALAAEIAGQWDIYPRSVQEGMRGINNVMKELGMLGGDPIKPPHYVKLGVDPSRRILADRDGLLMAIAEPGDEVEKDQCIARILDVLTLERVDVKSPTRGIIYHLGPSGPNRDVKLPAMHPLMVRGHEVALIYER